MKELKDQIEDARDRVAQYRLRAERPNARLEDEFALEKARNRLLTLELRSLRLELNSGDVAKTWGDRRPVNSNHTAETHRRREVNQRMRTKHKQLGLSARERAETAFAALKKDASKDMEDR